MIINSITLKNFQCYYGEHLSNQFEFERGVNLIVGDNGAGKSKLYDAFYWVLYDQIFLSDTREFVTTAKYGEKLISDKATRECEIGNTITTEVTIWASTSQDKEYKLTRIFHATKINERAWAKESSKLLVESKASARWAPVDPSKHEAILNLVIPKHLKPYMWFQGEQVDSLMDFKDKSALTHVINLLSDISVYDDLISITDKASQKADKEFRTAEKKHSSNATESELLDVKYENLKKSLQKTLDKKTDCESNLESAQNNLDKLINQIGDAENKARLKEKKRQLVKDFDFADKSLTNQYNKFSGKMFSDFWVLKNANSSIEKFAKRYQTYFTKHSVIANPAQETNIRLPINIPQPIHINQMITEEKCFVCGRDAKEGSEPHKHILTLLERNTPRDINELFENDCSKYFENLYNGSLGFKQTIASTENRIKEEYGSIGEKKKQLTSYREEITRIDEEFEQLIDDDNSETIVQSFKIHSKNRETYAVLNNDLEQEIVGINKHIKDTEDHLARLVTGEIDKVTEESKIIFDRLKTYAEETKNNVFRSIISELEKKANEIFHYMAERNNSITGLIMLKKIGKNSYIPEIVDDEGFVISSPNDSNIILVKLALIMAIVTSKPKWSENYSLVSDAPTSKMAEKYTYGFYEALSKNFSQSIITTFDFLDMKKLHGMKGINIGNIYKLDSVYPSGDRNNRADLSIKITKVQQ
jgi:DNA sulfur modification protein DndD